MTAIKTYGPIVFGIVVALVGLYRLVAFHGQGELLSGVLVASGAAIAMGGKFLADRLRPVVELAREAEGKAPAAEAEVETTDEG